MKKGFILIDTHRHFLRIDHIYSWFDIYNILDNYFYVQGYNRSHGTITAQYIRKSDIIEMIEL